MSVAYTNNQDATRLLKKMSEEQKEWMKREIATRKVLHVFLGRSYNKSLCEFVEKGLSE